MAKEQKENMVQDRLSGLTYNDIAKKWGCNRHAVSEIISEEYNRLLDENRKLFNEWERLKKENETLKEKVKNLPRIATLNKRIHELRQENEKLVRQLSHK